MRLRMADEDREKYGGPEELDFADVSTWLDGLGYDDLVAVEDQVVGDLGPAKPGEPQPTLLWVLDQLLSHTRESGRIRMIRVRVWLSLRAAGVDVALANFRPARLYAMRVVRASDAVPPVDASDSSPTSSPESADATTTIPESASSTGGSTPGPGAPTE
jgi:hypothetical protein